GGGGKGGGGPGRKGRGGGPRRPGLAGEHGREPGEGSGGGPCLTAVSAGAGGSEVRRGTAGRRARASAPTAPAGTASPSRRGCPLSRCAAGARPSTRGRGRWQDSRATASDLSLGPNKARHRPATPAEPRRAARACNRTFRRRQIRAMCRGKESPFAVDRGRGAGGRRPG